jgi:hypothetical protein
VPGAIGLPSLPLVDLTAARAKRELVDKHIDRANRIILANPNLPGIQEITWLARDRRPQ